MMVPALQAIVMHPLAMHHVAKGGEAVKAGPVGLGVILLLCIACYFLFKSMSKHLRNVRENFPAEGVSQPPDKADEPTQTPAE